jgi:hypothetical protein
MVMDDTKELAKHLESFGRFGDSTLVHLNPIEVDLLKSLSPTGELTTNPDTGLQEAFLPFLLSLLAPQVGAALGVPSWLAAAGLGGAGSALMGGDGKDILRDAALGGVGSAVGGMFKGGNAASKVGEKMAAMDGAPAVFGDAQALAQNAPLPTHSLPQAARMPSNIGGGVGDWIAKHPMAAMGGAGLAGMALSGGFGKEKVPGQPVQDNSLPAPTIGNMGSVIPLQNPYTYGIDGGEQNFFTY